MRAVIDQRFVLATVSRVDYSEGTEVGRDSGAVGIELTQAAAPRVRDLVREAVREPFRYLSYERVICGTAGIRRHLDVQELRIRDDKILRQSCVAKQAAGFTSCKRIGVDVIRQSADITVRDERSSCRVLPQGRRTRECCTVHDAKAGHIAAQKHLVE